MADRLDRQESVDALVHDVRHGVGTILTLISAGRHEVGRDSEAAPYLEAIELEAHSIAALCRCALGGSTKNKRTRVDLVATRVAQAAARSFEGVIETSLQPASVMGDEVTLGRMLRNLVDNACRAAGSKGRVCISIRRIAEAITVSVCDSGSGFTNGAPIEGMGLAIVQAIARAHGGHVTFERDPAGATAVVVTLSAYPVRRSSSRSSSQRAGKGASE